MKRTDITQIFENATREQIDALLDINSADIGEVRRENTRLQSELTAAKGAIAELRSGQSDLEALRQRVSDYEKADADRKAAEEAAAKRAELLGRMDAVLGDRKFIHERMRDVVADDFAAALQDKANLGKSDKDVFDFLTLDKGYFASQNPPRSMPPVGDVDNGQTSALSDAEYYAKIFNKTDK